VRPFVLLAIALSSLGGCSPYVNRGETLYREGRYIEAAEVFELTEARLKASPIEVRAEYGLYRGLTYLRLDDLRNAHVWLTYATTVEKKTPGQLTSDERTLLDRAWKELADRTRDRGFKNVEPERVASTDPATGARLGTSTTPNGRRSVATE
jgi:tetratricopeptide (TPR) repeat protein